MARPISFNQKEFTKTVTHLFWEKGYHAVSTQDILDATGISRSSLYNTYTDKEGIFLHVFKSYQQRAQSEMARLMGDDSMTAYEAFSSLFNGMKTECNASSDRRGCFVLNTAIELAPHNPQIQLLVDNHRKALVDLFRAKLEDDIEKGVLSKDTESYQTAQFLFTVMNGIKADTKYTQDKTVLEYSITTALTVLKTR